MVPQKVGSGRRWILIAVTDMVAFIRQRSSIERKLHESGVGNSSDPTRRLLEGIFETKSLPHQICICKHFLPNVQGPIRSEMMIITAVIFARMRKTRFEDQETFPVGYSPFPPRYAPVLIYGK